MQVIVNGPRYEAESTLVWQQVLQDRENFIAAYKEHIYAPYLNGYNRLRLNPNKLPSLESLSEPLYAIGWKPVFVDGYLSTSDYLTLLSQKKVPISAAMRSIEHINYALAPDLIHDVIGHIPMLFCDPYVEYLLAICKKFTLVKPSRYDQELFDAQNNYAKLVSRGSNNGSLERAKKELDRAELMLQKNPSQQFYLSRMFLWTIEFGLIAVNKKPKLYGAALMSSSLEAEKVCAAKATIKTFSLEQLTNEFHFSHLQDHVFVANSFNTLHQDLELLTETGLPNYAAA